MFQILVTELIFFNLIKYIEKGKQKNNVIFSWPSKTDD